MSSPSSPCSGSRLNPWAMARSSAAVTVASWSHDDHVGPGHHHLAGDRVAELDDALDELALLVLDDLVLGGCLDDAEQLLLADERPLLQALAGQQHVGQPDQAAADQAQRRERHEQLDGARRGERRPARVCSTAHVLGIDSARTKNTTTLSTKPTIRPVVPEQPVGEDRRQERLTRLQDRDRDEQRVDEPLRVTHQPVQGLGRLRARGFGERLRLDARDPVERRLGGRQRRPGSAAAR